MIPVPNLNCVGFCQYFFVSYLFTELYHSPLSLSFHHRTSCNVKDLSVCAVGTSNYNVIPNGTFSTLAINKEKKSPDPCGQDGRKQKLITTTTASDKIIPNILAILGPADKTV